MFKIRQVCLKVSQKVTVTQLCNYLRKYSSAPVSAIPKQQKNFNETDTDFASNISKSEVSLSKNPMIAAAFAALNSNKPDEVKTPKTDERIKGAKNIEELLNLSEGSGLSRRFALKLVSVLADWCTEDKVRLSDFDRDPRFIRLCRILTKKSKTNLIPQNEDLSMVVNITADDEAARLINNLTVPQMVRVVEMLVAKNRRSLSLLRSISFNISRANEQLDLKQCADLLYGAAYLNYIDDTLFEKICCDISVKLKENTRGSAIVGSILTSFGLLRYKDEIVLNALTDWIVNNTTKTRPQDVFSLFLTLAVNNHQPENNEQLYNTFILQLSQTDALKITTWLDYVWSLIVLKQATDQHLESILKESFVLKVEEEFQVPHKLKILNINAAANLLYKEYKGSLLSARSNIHKTIPLYSKNKKALSSSVIESLSNLFPLDTYLKTEVNTGLGFFIDGECLIDKQGNPLPFNKLSDKSQKVAVMVFDFHDMCRGKMELTGMNVLFERLLQAQGYKVLIIPYTEYNPKDKLVQRVQYLKSKLKAII